MPRVISSVIQRLAYDAERRQLHVIFHQTGAYTYFAVPPQVYQAFLAASFKGAFFNAHIRDRYAFQRPN